MSNASNPVPQSASTKQSATWLGWAVFLVALAATFLLGMLGATIFERRVEAEKQVIRKPIGEWETDNAVWGENYPREYGSFKEMLNPPPPRTKYGNGAPHRDYLAQTPANVILFAGYGFAKDYWQARAHVFAVEDVSKTQRLKPDSPATCWTCKSPDVPRMMHELGGEDIDKLAKGAELFYAAPFAEMKKEVTHPIGCLDCHDPKTMKLRVSRPALREAFARQGKNIDNVSHQEMRTLVCAQCHVEYYFQPKTNYLAFPWDEGMTPEKMEEYYDGIEFADWTHAVSKTKMVKMQHPDYEVYASGVHAYRNVSCADCHMPYRTEGGVKYSNHRLQSPLFDISNSCAVCHRWSEDEIRNRVYAIQDKVHEGRQSAEAMLAKAHFDIAAAMEAGAAEEELANVRKLVRSAQLRWDYVAANNGMGFHSPLECERILAAALDLSGQARVECARILAKRGHTEPVKYPDYGTKEKAQELNKQFIDGKPPKLL
ncbi:MAG: ammonia-forming cytochrome c nitrite reductase subunit c552 [Pirellulales bacterium]|nr:ammonia-forming cytochrome c nitrite reductase subunit c552 [Pirellulales bacterium]